MLIISKLLKSLTQFQLNSPTGLSGKKLEHKIHLKESMVLNSQKKKKKKLGNENQ